MATYRLPLPRAALVVVASFHSIAVGKAGRATTAFRCLFLHLCARKELFRIEKTMMMMILYILYVYEQ